MVSKEISQAIVAAVESSLILYGFAGNE
ncbi:hypothetical protein [Pseudobacillus wudalianchiensis]